MTDVFHHYVGKDGKRPKLNAEQRKQQDARAELLREQTREKAAKATLAEADLARQRRELIDRDTAQRQASLLFTTFRERLLSIPRTLPRKLAGKSQHEMRSILDEKLREFLEELSELPDRITREDYVDA